MRAKLKQFATEWVNANGVFGNFFRKSWRNISLLLRTNDFKNVTMTIIQTSSRIIIINSQPNINNLDLILRLINNDLTISSLQQKN